MAPLRRGRSNSKLLSGHDLLMGTCVPSAEVGQAEARMGTVMMPKGAEQPRPTLTFARFVPTPENRAALLAVQEVAGCLRSGRQRRTINPFFLHGPPGSGKTHLMSALVAEITRDRPDLTATALPASALSVRPPPLP